MFIVLIIMLGGMASGYLLRHQTGLHRTVSQTIMPTVCILLFLMGISIGSQDQLIEHLSEFGKTALMLTIGAVAGSVICAWLVYRYFFIQMDRSTQSSTDQPETLSQTSPTSVSISASPNLPSSKYHSIQNNTIKQTLIDITQNH